MASITKQKLNEVIKEELDGLILEAYRKKDLKTLQQIYIHENGRLDEGFGSWLKGKVKGAVAKVADIYKGIKDIGIGKHGAGLLMGGKHVWSFEKRQAMRKQATDELNATLTSLNYKPLTDLNKELDTVYEYPNTGNPEAFKEATKKLQDMYNKVVADFNAKKMPANIANSIIGALRQVVNYYADFKMNEKGIYKSGMVRESLKLKLREEYGEVGQASGRGEDLGSANKLAAHSMKFPAGLMLTGAAFTGLGIAADSPVVRDILFRLRDVVNSRTPDTTEIARAIGEEVVVEKGDGFWKTAEKFAGVRLDPNGPMSQITGNPKVAYVFKALKGALLHSEGEPVVDDILAGRFDTQKLGSFFTGNVSGIGSSKLGISPGKFNSMVERTITRAGTDVTSFPDTLKNRVIGLLTSGGFAAALKGIGLGALVAGAVSAGMRIKGRMSSRATTLHNLEMSFRNVQDGGQGQAAEEPGQAAEPQAAGEPAAAEPAAKQGGSGTLIKPEEFMSGTGEFGEQGREVLNFYKKKLPDIPPDVVDKTIGWLVRNNRMLSEMLRKANARLLTEGVGHKLVITKSFAILLKEAMVKNAQGIYVPQVDASNYSSGQNPRTSRDTGLGSRGVFSAQAGADNFGAKTNNPAGKADPTSISDSHPIWRVLSAYVRRDTGVKDLSQIEKVLKLVVVNKKMASHPEDNQEAQELDASKANQVTIPGKKPAAAAEKPAATAEKPAAAPEAPAAEKPAAAPAEAPKSDFASKFMDISGGAKDKEEFDKKKLKLEEIQRLKMLAGIKKK